jgi:hypothetical protein
MGIWNNCFSSTFGVGFEVRRDTRRLPASVTEGSSRGRPANHDRLHEEASMTAFIGTEISLPTLVRDFLELEVEGLSAAHLALPFLSGPDERARVERLHHLHEHHLEVLRCLARDCGVSTLGRGTPHEARTHGLIRLAHEEAGDGPILEALADSEARAVEAYDRALTSTALPDEVRPAFAQARCALRTALGELRLHARIAS